MDNPKILSGEQIVAKGITKIDATLPEIGLKDVSPSGSWLEQKQIQAALEARKHLIEVERIEKCGTLSHAEWQEDVMLAEVTQKAGGYWQYFGHSVGKKLFLQPEEALFLIEVNCLLLKHNEVPVSLQKAYSLLLHGTVSLMQYRVYASLSRLGYKVFRHKHVSKRNGKNDQSNISDKSIDTLVHDSETCTDEVMEGKSIENVENMDSDDKNPTDKNLVDSDIVSMEVDMIEKNGITHVLKEKSADDNSCERSFVSDLNNKEDSNISSMVDDNVHNTKHVIDNTQSNSNVNINSQKQPCYVTTLQKLRNRQLKPSDWKKLQKYFESIPDLFQKQVVTVNVPNQEHIPKNIFVNKSTYMLNMESIRLKTVRPVSNESTTYSVTDEVNGDHVRRIRATSRSETPLNLRYHLNFNLFQNTGFARQNTNFRPFNFWRPQNNFNCYQFGMYFQRPLLHPYMYFLPRCQSNTTPRSNARKRSRLSLKNSQLQGIKALASRYKHLIMSGTQLHNIGALHKLLHTYNTKHKTRLRLTPNFDVVNDETIVETIELDDDDESKSKKPRLDDRDNKFKENLNRLKELAAKLKALEFKNKANARHRRVFSNAIKTFNKSYNADVYLSSNYEVVDRRYIDLDSSSESDCVVEEPQISTNKKKLLRNPFNLLKQRNEKLDLINVPTTSKDDKHIENDVPVQNYKYNEFVKNVFTEKWLPSEDDFGRAEVVSKLVHIIDECKDEYLFDFMSGRPKKYENWLEAKISFLKHIENANIAFQQNQLQHDFQELSYTGLRPLIGAEDCLDKLSVLEKIRIIKNNKDTNAKNILRIDFDVYNRNVNNFRKTNPPVPHFRVICMHESTCFPTADDVAALQGQYEDNVPIVFAVVGISSVSYLQINPTDLPIYTPNSD